MAWWHSQGSRVLAHESCMKEEEREQWLPTRARPGGSEPLREQALTLE